MLVPSHTRISLIVRFSSFDHSLFPSLGSHAKKQFSLPQFFRDGLFEVWALMDILLLCKAVNAVKGVFYMQTKASHLCALSKLDVPSNHLFARGIAALDESSCLAMKSSLCSGSGV